MRPNVYSSIIYNSQDMETTSADEQINKMCVCMCACVYIYISSLVAQMVKCLPIMQETWVQSLGQEDLLEKEMATHSSILAWKIPWAEEPGQAMVHGVSKSRTRLSDFTHFTHTYIYSTHTYICYIYYTMEYYSTIKGKMLSFATTWIDLEVLCLVK